MKDLNPDLDRMISRLAGSRSEPPAGMEAGVWRAIEQRREPAKLPSIFDGLFAIIASPSGVFSVAGLTVVVAVGMGLTDVGPSASANAPLGLAVFASDAPALPSSLIGHSR